MGLDPITGVAVEDGGSVVSHGRIMTIGDGRDSNIYSGSDSALNRVAKKPLSFTMAPEKQLTDSFGPCESCDLDTTPDLGLPSIRSRSLAKSEPTATINATDAAKSATETDFDEQFWASAERVYQMNNDGDKINLNGHTLLHNSDCQTDSILPVTDFGDIVFTTRHELIKCTNPEIEETIGDYIGPENAAKPESDYSQALLLNNAQHVESLRNGGLDNNTAMHELASPVHQNTTAGISDSFRLPTPPPSLLFPSICCCATSTLTSTQTSPTSSTSLLRPLDYMPSAELANTTIGTPISPRSTQAAQQIVESELSPADSSFDYGYTGARISGTLTDVYSPVLDSHPIPPCSIASSMLRSSDVHLSNLQSVCEAQSLQPTLMNTFSSLEEEAKVRLRQDGGKLNSLVLCANEDDTQPGAKPLGRGPIGVPIRRPVLQRWLDGTSYQYSHPNINCSEVIDCHSGTSQDTLPSRLREPKENGPNSISVASQTLPFETKERSSQAMRHLLLGVEYSRKEEGMIHVHTDEGQGQHIRRLSTNGTGISLLATSDTLGAPSPTSDLLEVSQANCNETCRAYLSPINTSDSFVNSTAEKKIALGCMVTAPSQEPKADSVRPMTGIKSRSQSINNLASEQQGKAESSGLASKSGSLASLRKDLSESDVHREV
ncbi:unnamed protein product [Protopolystoma xenopodis]|uniref:Uncharacterized protein n=1 Tax=Protopolystoma xenopodis TaxID=117903 RepID=A0A448WBQ0_9PLAT|nr:unnamed protein product [Protopolystoma xenopodis]